MPVAPTAGLPAGRHARHGRAPAVRPATGCLRPVRRRRRCAVRRRRIPSRRRGAGARSSCAARQRPIAAPAEGARPGSVPCHAGCAGASGCPAAAFHHPARPVRAVPAVHPVRRSAAPALRRALLHARPGPRRKGRPSQFHLSSVAVQR
ncbi:hypothetical protein G6F23_014275 [Rhizopus arrhizus]|nr:hypothetical protein G6F23_014275 [Rhizopus arrhizus]